MATVELCRQAPTSTAPDNKKNPRDVEATRGFRGPDRRRSGDLSIFSRTLYQLSYRTKGVLNFLGTRARPTGQALHSATLTGLEPATSAVTGRRANRLRYRAMGKKLYPSRRHVTDVYPQRDSNPCRRRERAVS